MQHPSAGDEREQRALLQGCDGAESGHAHHSLPQPCLPQPCCWSWFLATRGCRDSIGNLSGRPTNSVPGNFFSSLLLAFRENASSVLTFLYYYFVGMLLARSKSAQLITFVVLFLDHIESAGERHWSDRVWSRLCVPREHRLYPPLPPTKAFPWSHLDFDYSPPPPPPTPAQKSPRRC